LATIFEKEMIHPPLELLFTVDEETGLNGALGLQTEYLQGRNIRLSIASNGYSLTTIPEETLLAFRDVEVSIDHPTQAEQDVWRGEGNWALVHQAIERCAQLGGRNACVIDGGPRFVERAPRAEKGDWVRSRREDAGDSRVLGDHRTRVGGVSWRGIASQERRTAAPARPSR
jgi:hypothetical protein